MPKAKLNVSKTMNKERLDGTGATKLIQDRIVVNPIKPNNIEIGKDTSPFTNGDEISLPITARIKVVEIINMK